MRKGRFSKPAAEIALRYGESVSFDWRLYRYDIAGSIAHAAALARAGTITAAERRKIETGLRAIQKEIESGKFKWDRSLEDVHMNIEAVLAKRIDTTGAKLHTARNRIVLFEQMFSRSVPARSLGRQLSLIANVSRANSVFRA